MFNSFLIVVAINKLVNFIEFMILIRVLLSWIPISKDNLFCRAIYGLTEPILAPIRNLIRKSPLSSSGMFIDFSPVIAVMLLYIIQSIIVEFII